MPQLEEDSQDFIFQQDGAPPYFHNDFFLWVFVKDRVFVPPLPRDLMELREQIREAFAAVTRDLLM